MNNYHNPIMVQEIKSFFNFEKTGDGVFFDGTLGGGGHSEMILQNITGRLISVDKDDDALAFARERLKNFQNFQSYKCDFKDASSLLEELKVEPLSGILLDLGVSSFQLDNFERGFSYRGTDAPLDMRMDKNQSFSAKELINSYSEKDLARIFKDYGEERFASQIASAICKVRKKEEIETTGMLVDIIKSVIPAHFGAKEGHPAKRVFQAVRIEVNGEIANLESSLESLFQKLKRGGRMCVLTFHSLEDRITKNFFKKMEADCICPKNFPVCVCGKRREGKVLSKKPITSGQEELESNSRAKSCKLRVIEKL